jgi:uncharacterized iron-regulated protein
MRNLRLLVLLLVVSASSLIADSRHLHLAIGDPARSQQETAVQLDVIVDTATGQTLSPDELAAALQNTTLLFIGETHTDIEFHRVQRRVIEALIDAGRDVLIGLEMFPYTEQEHLDAWSRGEHTEEEFIDTARWYENWGNHWGYYRGIFLVAKEHGLPMHAINAPRSAIRSVRQKGFENLTEEEAAHIPTTVDTESDEQRELFKAMFDPDEMHGQMSDEQLEGMFRAQCTWDATMAFNAVNALKSHDSSKAIMVVLIGSGHVAYGLGIERQAAQWFDGKMASIIPVPAKDDDDQPIETVQASYANYIWGLPAQRDPFYPSLGLSAIVLRDAPYRQVIDIGEDTVAERADFELGDVLLAMDGVDLTSREAMMRRISELSWGDVSTFKIRRDGEEIEIEVPFTRTPEESEEED